MLGGLAGPMVLVCGAGTTDRRVQLAELLWLVTWGPAHVPQPALASARPACTHPAHRRAARPEHTVLLSRTVTKNVRRGKHHGWGKPHRRGKERGM
jgi:hypothetical protein